MASIKTREKDFYVSQQDRDTTIADSAYRLMNIMSELEREEILSLGSAVVMLEEKVSAILKKREKVSEVLSLIDNLDKGVAGRRVREMNLRSLESIKRALLALS